MIENISYETIFIERSKRNDLLKIVGIIAMVIDHIGVIFFPGIMIYRTIGRVAFPIFAYQLTVGFKKTSNYYRYLFRVLIFALISQIPYSFFNTHFTFNPYRLNIMFTLALGLIILKLIHQLKKEWRLYKKYYKNIFLLKAFLFSGIFLVIIGCLEYLRFINAFFSYDYGLYGLGLIVLFYLFDDSYIKLFMGYLLFSLLISYYNFSFYEAIQESNSLGLINNILSFKNIVIYYKSTIRFLVSLSGPYFQLRSISALLVIAFLEKSQLFKISINKYISYWFYPVHLGILIALNYLYKIF